MRYLLNEENIDKAAEQITEYLSAAGIETKEITRVRLGVEEALLRYLELQEGIQEFELRLGKSFGRIKVTLLVEGRMFDPFIKRNTLEESSSFMRAALVNMGELPVWRYSRGVNSLSYSLTKKHLSSWLQLLIAVALAFLVGMILRSVPSAATDFIDNGIITPLIDTFMRLLTAIAQPMIFLAIVWGIYSIGDVSAFSVIGKRLFGTFLIFTTLITLAAGMIVIPTFSLISGNSAAGDDFSSVFSMILNIVPENILQPITDGNTLQILFLAIIIGIAMIILGERTQTVAIFAEQMNYIVQLVMETIQKLVPYFVFISILDIVLNDEATRIGSSYKLFIVNIAAYLVQLIVCAALVGIRTKIPMFAFLKIELKTLLICLTTASSAAAFATRMDTCRKELGIEESLTNFGIPFAQVLFQPSSSVLYLTSAIFIAESFGVPVSAGWIIAAILLSIIVSMATPPVPGGTLVGISVLFAQLGLPGEGIAIVLALNIILDFAETAVDAVGGDAMLTLGANHFHMLGYKKSQEK